MKRFSFRLEKVLGLRRYKEREVEMRLAQATAVCVRLEEEIRDLDLKSRETLGVMTTSLDPSWILSCEAYRRRLTATKVRKEEELIISEAKRLAVQKEFLEAQTERKILDKLKDKKLAAHKKTALQNEYKIQDDRNTGAFIKAREQ